MYNLFIDFFFIFLCALVFFIFRTFVSPPSAFYTTLAGEFLILVHTKLRQIFNLQFSNAQVKIRQKVALFLFKHRLKTKTKNTKVKINN